MTVFGTFFLFGTLLVVVLLNNGGPMGCEYPAKTGE